MTIKLSKKANNSRIVSPKIPKSKKLNNDPIVKAILEKFDKGLKREFIQFLQEKSQKVVPITAAKKIKKVKKIEGKEPISFLEISSYGNPLFSVANSFLQEEYNPDTIDVDTYDLMRRDQQLALGLAFIKLPIRALSWTISCSNEEIAKTVEWALKRIWKDLMKSTLLAVDYGFVNHEKVWMRENVKVSKIDKNKKETIYHNGDLVFFKKIKPNHPGGIKIKFDDKQNILEVIQEALSGGEEVRLPIRKCFLFTHEKEFGNPFGISRLKNAYKVWYWKELLYQFMMQYYERRGTPPTVATAPPGRSQDSSGAEIDNLELALRLASSLMSNSTAVIPYTPSKDGKENMWKLDLMKDDARGPMFIDALQHLDARCLRALFIPESVISSGESFSGSSVHADLFLMSEGGLTSDIEDAVNEQLILPFIEANYSPEERKDCFIKFDPLDWNRKITLKEIFVELVRNVDTMIQMGVPPMVLPDIEKVAEILNIPVSSWEDITGLSPEELKERLAPKEENNDKNIDSNDDDDDDLKDKKSDKNKDKETLAGRKKTRGKSVDQTQDRKKINPGGRRADRNRKADPNKKR